MVYKAAKILHEFKVQNFIFQFNGEFLFPYNPSSTSTTWLPIDLILATKWGTVFEIIFELIFKKKKMKEKNEDVRLSGFTEAETRL